MSVADSSQILYIVSRTPENLASPGKALAPYHYKKKTDRVRNSGWELSLSHDTEAGITVGFCKGTTDSEIVQSINHLKASILEIGNPMLFVEHPPSQKMIQAKETVFKRGMKAFRSVPGEKQLALTGHLPVHPKDLPLLGQLVWKMYRKMTRVSQDPQSLYYLTVQVFPVHSGIES